MKQIHPMKPQFERKKRKKITSKSKLYLPIISKTQNMYLKKQRLSGIKTQQNQDSKTKRKFLTFSL